MVTSVDRDGLMLFGNAVDWVGSAVAGVLVTGASGWVLLRLRSVWLRTTFGPWIRSLRKLDAVELRILDYMAHRRDVTESELFGAFGVDRPSFQLHFGRLRERELVDVCWPIFLGVPSEYRITQAGLEAWNKHKGAHQSSP
jgi:hypothetical protein